jgi:hypothetical protein
MKPLLVRASCLILFLLVACGQAAVPTPTLAPPTATQLPPTATQLPPTPTEIPPTATPTKTLPPPTETPVPKILKGTQGSYQLIDVEMDRSLLPGNNNYPLPMDYTILQLKFECTATNLIAEYDLAMSVATNVYLRNGFATVFVKDNQNNKFPAIDLSLCSLFFPVPESSRGFVLYFKDFPPLEIGE